MRSWGGGGVGRGGGAWGGGGKRWVGSGNDEMRNLLG